MNPRARKGVAVETLFVVRRCCRALVPWAANGEIKLVGMVVQIQGSYEVQTALC